MSTDRLESRRKTDGGRGFVFDVLVDGEPVRRQVEVSLTGDALRIGDREIPLDTVFWVSRRAGLMLVFGRERTLAVLGKSGDLEELARGVERGSDRAAQRSLLQPLTREVVVCTAGTAVSGHIAGIRISGLHLAVFTQRGLHLFAGSGSRSIEWPVKRVSEIDTAPGTHGRGGLRLSGPGVDLTLRYLFPEEVQAIARAARRSPEPDDPPDAAIEMFAKGEVAPPPAAALPEFALSAEALRHACDAATARVEVTPVLETSFGPRFFEQHFQDLGEIALGPLLARTSAASGAGSLGRAVDALAAEQLREDVEAAFRTASNHLLRVYAGEVDRLANRRRLGTEVADEAREVDDERGRLEASFARNLEALAPTFERLLARQHLVLQRLKAAEHAPPDADDGGLEEAAEAWRKDVVALDRAYGDAWSDVLVEIADLWSERLLPRLLHLTAVPSPRLSEGARLAILATVTFAIVAALAWWVF